MSALVRTLLLTLSAAAAFGASGDAAPRQQPPAAPAAPTSAPPTPAASPGSAGAPAAGRDIDDFVPTEHVKADDAVSFPTDI
jgi:hypothetical protein